MTTKVLILTCWLLISVNTETVVQPPCDIVIDGFGYEAEPLIENMDRPFMMAVDYTSNTLFFSYSTKDEDAFASRWLDLKTKVSADIAGVEGGFAHGVDNKNHKVYIGGGDGIYEYDYSTKKATFIGAKGHNIWNIFYKDVMYFVTYPYEKLYKFENGQATDVGFNNSRVEIVALDKNNNVYISNDTGLYRFDKDFKEAKYYGDYAINGMTSDSHGDIYFSTPSSLNKITSDGNGVQKLVELKDVYGLAVEADGTLIYANDNNIYRLKVTKVKCPIQEEES